MTRPDAGDMQVRRFLISLPRSGTHWLKQMICRVMRMDPLERRLLDPASLEAAFRSEAVNRLCYDHLDFISHSPVLDHGRYPGLRIVLLYRHPLDSLISSFYLLEAKGLLPFEKKDVKQNIKEYLSGNIDPVGLNADIRNIRLFQMTYPEYLRRTCTDWIVSGKPVFCLRFEELVDETAVFLKKTLQHLEIQFSDQDIVESVENNRFEILSGGRKRGVEDRKSHYRKGTAGGWKDFFDGEELAMLQGMIGEHLSVMGYAPVAGGRQP